MKRKISTLFMLIACSIIFCAAYSESVLSDIQSSQLLRLHIIANSNSLKDQSLKLAVRDELLKEGVLQKNANLDIINEICIKKIREQGEDYGARSETGNFYFPTKSYKNIHLPAGHYNALRVVLGEGKGENWWCVMYPPLCFTEGTMGEMSEENENKLREMLSKDSYSLISGEEAKIVPAFRVVEIWQEFKEKMRRQP